MKKLLTVFPIVLFCLPAINFIYPSKNGIASSANTRGQIVITQSDSISTLEKEKEAIRKVIGNETEAYYKQDFEGWKSNFVNADCFRQDDYREQYPDRASKNSGEKRYNENLIIYGNMASYTFEQDSFDSQIHKFPGKSVEVRILEKNNGHWKIAYLGFQYLPCQRK